MRHSTTELLTRTLLGWGVAFGLTALSTAPAAAQAAGQAGKYRVVATHQLGGDGGWDYLALDTVHNRLFIARSDRVMVVDPD
jgi:hypothetical protein